jgi:uncharacterized SAM-binding protein YcdF (DUF218 family)
MHAPNGTDQPNRAPRLRLLFAILGVLALLLTTTSFVIVVSVGKWLVREDPLQPATAIVILSGNMPTRALEAAVLYHEGYAKEIWLTHPDDHADALKELGINYPSEDEFNTRVLRRAGVPAKAIHVFETPIINTDEELDEISAALKAKGGKDVIIVTNKSHTRRVHILWTKYYASRGSVIVHGLPDDEFVANRWWRDPGSMTQVAHEVLGIINAWGGLPVKRQLGPTPTEVVADRANSANTTEPQRAAAD